MLCVIKSNYFIPKRFYKDALLFLFFSVLTSGVQPLEALT